MSKFDDKIVEWSEQQFSIKLSQKQSLNFLRTKNGPTFQKLLTFMSHRIKSKKNGEKMKRFCESVKCSNELQTIENEIKEIESNINRIRIELVNEEMKRKTIAIKKSRTENQLFVLSTLVNIIEKISVKNKHCTELTQNSVPINETICCYDKLLAPFDDSNLQNSHPFAEAPNANNNLNRNLLIDEINELIENTNFILFDINEFDTNKSIDVNFDIEVLSKSLLEANQVIEIHKTEEIKNEKGLKNHSNISKLKTIHNLIQEYQRLREEKMARNKDKLEKVIHSCDSFIQQRRLKC